MNLFITLLENVNKSRTSANNVSLIMYYYFVADITAMPTVYLEEGRASLVQCLLQVSHQVGLAFEFAIIAIFCVPITMHNTIVTERQASLCTW
jgi:hypothetical protein